MKHAIKFLASMTLVFFVAVSMSAQTATTVVDKSETKNCDVKNCDPTMCDLMVKAGLCTKEQVDQCKAICSAKSTKVAAASMEKVDAMTVSSTNTTSKASCAKSCSKTCSSKNVGKTQ